MLRVAPGVGEQIAVALVGVGARHAQFARRRLPLEGAHHLRPLFHPRFRVAPDESAEGLARGRHGLDQARGKRFGSGQHARAAQEFKATRGAEDRGEIAAAAPGGGDIERALHETDARMRRGDAHVAGHRQFGAAAQRNAIQRRHHRHGEGADRIKRAAAQIEQGARLLQRAHLLQVAQVAARGETLVARAGQNRQHQPVVAAVLVEHVAQPRQHRARQRVALLRAVDGDPQQALFDRDENVGTQRLTPIALRQRRCASGFKPRT